MWQIIFIDNVNFTALTHWRPGISGCDHRFPHRNSMHECRRRTHALAVTDFRHRYGLTPINHKLERLSGNVMWAAGAGTVGWLNVSVCVYNILYSCWRSCHWCELWPWPLQRWVTASYTHTHTESQMHLRWFRAPWMASCCLCQVRFLFDVYILYKYIKLLRMALNPFRSIDTLTSH